MKTTMSKISSVAVLAFVTVIASVPAHATVFGGDPRPTFSTASMFISTLLSVLGY